MTAERFEYTFEGIEDTLETNEENKYISCNKDGFQDLCEMLNELHEENVELKKEIGDLGTAHAEEINKIEDEFYEEILKLERENEELKKVAEEFAQKPTQHNLWKLRTVLKELKGDVE